MKLPRDVSGEELASRLSKYGYTITRQSGSHLRLTSCFRTTAHHITIPKHASLTVGTLNNILKDVSIYLNIGRDELLTGLFLVK